MEGKQAEDEKGEEEDEEREDGQVRLFCCMPAVTIFGAGTVPALAVGARLPTYL